MAMLDELMKIRGVVAAGPFTDNGRLPEVRGDLKPGVAQVTAKADYRALAARQA